MICSYAKPSIFWVLYIVASLSLIPQPLVAASASYSNEQVIDTLRQCCFPDDKTKLLLFKEPIKVLFYNLTKLDETQIELIKLSFDIIKNKSRIDFSYEKANLTKIDSVQTSTVAIVALPYDRNEIGPDQLKVIYNLYSVYSRKNPEPSNINSFLDYLYIPRHFALIAQSSVDHKLASVFFVRLNEGNVQVEQTVERALLASLGYNKNLKLLKNSIFSIDAYDVTELDYIILKLLYEDGSIHAMNFEDAVKRLR